VGITNRIRFVPMLLAVALAGCGDDATSPSLKCGILGSSDVNINGSVTASVDACASYTVSTGGSPTTVVALVAGSLATPTHRIALTRQGARPVVGSYAIGAAAGNFAGTFILDGGSGADRTFAITGGSISISASSSGTLVGTFTSVTGAEVSTPANTITLSGTFSAKCIDTADTDC